MPLNQEVFNRHQASKSSILDLSGKRLIDQDLNAIILYLQRSSHIDHLNLSNGFLTSNGMARLAALKQLRVLNLSSNFIGPKGARALLNNKTLWKLDLSDNFIADTPLLLDTLGFRITASAQKQTSLIRKALVEKLPEHIIEHAIISYFEFGFKAENQRSHCNDLRLALVQQVNFAETSKLRNETLIWKLIKVMEYATIFASLLAYNQRRLMLYFIMTFLPLPVLGYFTTAVVLNSLYTQRNFFINIIRDNQLRPVQKARLLIRALPLRTLRHISQNQNRITLFCSFLCIITNPLYHSAMSFHTLSQTPLAQIFVMKNKLDLYGALIKLFALPDPNHSENVCFSTKDAQALLSEPSRAGITSKDIYEKSKHFLHSFWKFTSNNFIQCLSSDLTLHKSNLHDTFGRAYVLTHWNNPLKIKDKAVIFSPQYTARLNMDVARNRLLTQVDIDMMTLDFF